MSTYSSLRSEASPVDPPPTSSLGGCSVSASRAGSGILPMIAGTSVPATRPKKPVAIAASRNQPPAVTRREPSEAMAVRMPEMHSRRVSVTSLGTQGPTQIEVEVMRVVRAMGGGLLWIVCLLYTSDAADDLLCVDLGGRRIIKKK